MSFPSLSPWPKGEPPSGSLCGEEERLAVIAGFGLEALSADDELDRITRFAAHLCKAPIATLSLVEPEKQRFLAREGIVESETPRSTSFCAQAMLGGEILEVLDATKDDRFAEFPNVTGGLKLRYYAGAPLISAEGAPLGALCVIDREPRSEPLSDLQREGLEVLAASVMRRLEDRRQHINDAHALEDSEARFRLLADSIPDIAWSSDIDGNFDYFNARWYEFIGTDDRPQEGWDEYFHPDDRKSWFNAWETARNTGDTYETEYRLKHNDGDYRWVIARGLPVRDTNGEVVRWFGTITDIDDKHRQSEANDLLARELAHRIKNVFSMLSSLLTLRTRGKPALKEFAGEMDQIVRALAQAQDFVMPLRSQEEQDLHGLLELLIQPYRNAQLTGISLSGDTTLIGPRAATPLALIVHELATNATKYGALSSEEGRVDLALEKRGDDMVIAWREIGGPSVERPAHEGFGTRLLKTTVENQLGGSWTRNWQSDGFSCTITVPIENLAE